LAQMSQTCVDRRHATPSDENRKRKETNVDPISPSVNHENAQYCLGVKQWEGGGGRLCSSKSINGNDRAPSRHNFAQLRGGQQ
jgi:hypothetical protein